MQRVSISITRNYGGFSVTWGLDSDGHEFTTVSEIRKEYDRLKKAVEVEIDLFEHDQLNAWGKKWAGGGAPAGAIDTKPSPADVGAWHDIAAVLVKVDGGKRLYRIKTHQESFAKWGVAVYDEVVKEYRLDEFLGADYEKKALAGRVYVVTSNGKSKAVKVEGLF